MPRLPIEADGIQVEKRGIFELRKEATMFERLPETIRVPLDSINLPDYHVLVVPHTKEPFPCRDFYLVHEPTGTTNFMFGCTVQADELAAEMAEWSARLYLSDPPAEE